MEMMPCLRMKMFLCMVLLLGMAHAGLTRGEGVAVQNVQLIHPSETGQPMYALMDLAGSVWERVISIGRAEGRAFEGSHGDGTLGQYGRATNADWPHTYAGAEGHGYRGGGYYQQGMRVHEFNPYSPVAYRRFGAWSGAMPSVAYGFRAARSADE